MRNLLQNLMRRLHSEERGAVMLALMAAFLIVFMTAMVLYDAGQAAQDKMDAQVSADTAAFSQAAIKARTMNMIAYANIAKKTFYAFDTMYTAAYLGMVEAAAAYSAACLSGELTKCWRAAKGAVQVLSETAELLSTNMFTMGVGGLGARFASREVLNLDQYQRYMKDVGVWWGWGEGVGRGIRNRGTMTTAWPPPPGNLSSVRQWFVRITNLADSLFGSNYSAFYPATRKVDELPILKDGSGDVLSSPIDWGQGVLDAGPLAGRPWADMRMCISSVLSFEYLWMWGEHYIQSEGFARDPLAILMGILSTPLGCLTTAFMLGEAALPYVIHPGASGSIQNTFTGTTDKNWLLNTSNIVFSYKIRPDRFSDDNDGDRQKFNYLSADYSEGTPIIKGGGYFAMTRSEMVYDGGLISDLAAQLQGSISGGSDATSVLSGSFPLQALRGLFDQPNMWAARWTARMRPLELPEEPNPTMTGMVLDVLPYMILTSPIAFMNSPSDFSFGGAQNFSESALLDLAAFYIAATGMSNSDGQYGTVK